MTGNTSQDGGGTSSADDTGTETSSGETESSSSDATNTCSVDSADDGAAASEGDGGSAAQGAGGSAATRPYSVASWLALVTALAGDIPVAFAQKWNAMESGGNPCATGAPGAMGPDGNPREMGIGQLYNPDNFQALGIDGGSWRAYCEGDTQTVTRDLTMEESKSQVNGMLGLIRRCRTAARAHNPGWSESSADFWSLVKLQHALPGLLVGMTAVTASLGRAPANWAEFRATVVSVTLDAKTMTYASEFARALDNAQAAGAAVT